MKIQNNCLSLFTKINRSRIRERFGKVNMQQEITHTALDNLQKTTNIQGKFTNATPKKEIDGKIVFTVNHRKIALNAEIKREVRPHILPQIIELAEKHLPFILIAETIYPKIKQQLREKHIAYLEANGNIFINNDDIFLLIDGNKPVKLQRVGGNRAFTKTGLRVVYQFLIDENWINKPYREIAEKTNTGLGNINNITQGLKAEGFLLKRNQDEYTLINKKELLQKWIGAYEANLKPYLFIGKFRFVKPEDFLNWKKIELQQNKTWWGGEPAGDLFTNYLRPGELTLYTLEDRKNLMKHYRLVPDTNGNIKIYKAFWYQGNELKKNVVHPLLAYTDLMNTGDRRCLETAQKIYDELLADKF